MDKKYAVKSLKGLINPVKVAPGGTSLTLVGLVLGLDAISKLWGFNSDLETENIVVRSFESIFGLGFLSAGIHSLCESYITYFKELKKTLKSGVNKGRLRLYNLCGDPCWQSAYKAAAKESGCYDEYISTIKEIKQEKGDLITVNDNKN
tara:strand:+ start:2243 stop:2689 length:447 start_codon:yes stop_codon:yes gene_type:complete